MTFNKCFLPSLGSCGQAVSEENIKMRKGNKRRTVMAVMAEPDMVFGQLNYELSKRSHDGTVTEISIVE